MKLSTGFQQSNCRHCNRLVWQGISATSACTVRLDTKRLNLVEEIQALMAGTRTYQLHRMTVGFEATRRTPIRMRAKDPVVLAEHICTNEYLFGETAPEYFDRPKAATPTEGFPF
jgi:hypothetical protein